MATEITRSRATANETPRSCVPGSVNVRSCLSFDALWTGHPLNWDPPETHPFRHPVPFDPFRTLTGEVLGDPIYQDQCAIKMSVALEAGGLPLSTYPKARSEVREVQRLKKKLRGALAAEELARWLTQVLGEPEKYKGADARAKVSGRKGIVFFKDFWQRDGESTAQGDHIDLWNGTTTPNQPPEFYQPEVNYFNRSISVWFWELK